ncbi:MAG TPA: hypothetical protein VJU53_06655 [Burkholderiaceae bacterium]|nr:hypothetical protein [Burkholderiaceae bacterium]
MSRFMSCVGALIPLAALIGPCAMAQTPEADRQREYQREQDRQREEQQRRAQEEMQRQERRSAEESKRRSEAYDESQKNVEQWRKDAAKRGEAATSNQIRSDMRAERPKLLAMPPVPNDRNVLLGRWRLEGSNQQSDAQNSRLAEFALTGKGSLKPGDLQGFISSMDSGKLACDMSFGSGITFTPTTYSSGGAAGMAGGPIAYRSGANKQVIVAIPGDTRANPMLFTIAGPNRIVWADTCALVRVGAPGANAAANATTAPGNTRAGGANSTAPQAAGGRPQVAAVAPASTLSRPSPEVCSNMLLDQLGKVGVNQVRAMSDLRFKEPAIEGKVPNSNNLRLDLRGSACDDPRVKATLYDFDANEMLQAITFVWERPPGPAPAPIFQERVYALSRANPGGLPPPQSSGRLQADTIMGRLILEDLPERNLLLEAYKAKK